MLGLTWFVPIELSGEKGLNRAGIGNAVSLLRISKFRKSRELFPASDTNEIAEFSLEVAKKRERLRAAPLLPHKEHRCLRQEEVNRCDGADNFRGRERGDSL